MGDFSTVIPILGALSAFLLTVSLVPVKSALDQTLEDLRTGAPGADKQHPHNRLLTVFDDKNTAGLRAKLIEAGWYTVTPTQFILRVAGCFVGALVAVAIASRLLHLSGIASIVVDLVLFVVIAYAPMYLLNQAAEQRKAQVQKTLPDFLDMIASTVAAGLSLNASLTYAIDAAPGALGEEIKEALSETRLGRSRADALKAAAKRLNQQEFSTTIAAITQAELLGANIAKILNELADDTRTHRILMVEEHAAKLPVKMVFPMALFLLPALFVIIFGTLVANYIASH